ncbi:MBL fold metallo-hydrolase [Streptomyces sp. NPDC003077]|uniref:MBL fold metallo-hydrolase n=1 Tax=Streptomyces sp. NPDC003077 TaxID=3154443 RepID=UPI0033A13901
MADRLTRARPRVRALGGPTVVIDHCGLRLVTDPTLDAAGGTYDAGPVTLRKTEGPAATAKDIGAVTAVLLSHDQHPDNLDTAGRAFLDTVPLVLTTPESADRLGGMVVGLPPWRGVHLPCPDGGTLTVTAIPARHGPEGTEVITGAVTGFLLSGTDAETVYISGDNVDTSVATEVRRRHGDVDVAVLHLGAAQLARTGPALLSMNGEQAVRTAKVLGARVVVPVHHDGWAHFTEGREGIVDAFARADRAALLAWPEAA